MLYLLGDQDTEWFVIRHRDNEHYPASTVMGRWGASRLDLGILQSLAEKLTQQGFACFANDHTRDVYVACGASSRTMIELQFPTKMKLQTAVEHGPKRCNIDLSQQTINNFVSKGVRVIKQRWLENEYQEITETR